MKLLRNGMLYEKLKAEAVLLSPGDSFASVRSIMKKYSVSQATVSIAMQRLVDEELLEKFRGKEAIVTEHILRYKTNAKMVICLAQPQWASEWLFTVENTFCSLADELNYELKVLRYPWRDVVPRALPAYKIDHMILMPACDLLSTEHQVVLNSLKVPITLFATTAPGLAFDYVGTDSEFNGASAANHLIELGHRHVAVVRAEPNGQVISDRLNGFVKMCELRNIACDVIDCGIVSGDDSMEKTYVGMRALLAGKKPDFTGIFVLSTTSVVSVLKALFERGYSVPADFSVLTVGYNRLMNYLHPSITHSEDSLERMARAAIEQIRAPRAEGEVKRLTLRTPLAIRESTASPGSGNPCSGSASKTKFPPNRKG